MVNMKMAWTTSNPQVHNTFSSLGQRHGDTYTANKDCLAYLEEILGNLVAEDCTYRTFRRAIGFGQNVQRDLIPLLISVRDNDEIENSTKIIDTIIKILVNLTIPVEYLLSIDAVSHTDVGRHTIYDLSHLLLTSKEAFTDSRSMKAVMDHIKFFIGSDHLWSVEQCDGINNCLLLIRNILHVPDHKTNIFNSPTGNLQNQIIWNLFTQSIDKIIIHLLSCSQKLYWGVTLVQLIALMYKDQHVGTLQKLLNHWLEVSLSESSEDNESNTSPPDRESGESFPIVSSDPTSDSSDNGGNSKERNKINNLSKYSATSRSAQSSGKSSAGSLRRNKSTETDASTSSGISMTPSVESADYNGSNSSRSLRDNTEEASNAVHSSAGCTLLQSEASDCGYVTQVENQEFISTSSNDDDQPRQKPVHQKPHTFQKTRHKGCKSKPTSLERKELRRKKLIKHSKTNIIKMKGLMHHIPTDEDITNVLKEFTVDFLLKGYAVLVQNLHSQLISTMHLDMDTSHFFWLITYFLKFATELELDFEHIGPVLSYDIISYLIFQGVLMCEDLKMIIKTPHFDLKPCLRRLHLVVTAIREFMHAVESYNKLTYLSEEDHLYIRKLQTQLGEMEDLKRLFLLLLRHYNPDLQSRQYLQDLILTNHNYLLLLDSISEIKGESSKNIMDHLKQFATMDIMHQYGLLLENFNSNGEFVNNCIFTMMHHVAGDLELVQTLFQPNILKTFSKIWEMDYELCDDWSDLIEYVIHKFINTRHTYCTNLTVASDEQYVYNCPYQSKTDNSDSKDALLKYYNEIEEVHDTVAHISRKYHENGITNKTKLSIIKELLDQNIINENQYRDFMKIEISESEKYAPENDSGIYCESHLPETVANGNIVTLKQHILEESKGRLIIWLEKTLLEACFVKLFLSNSEAFKNNAYVMEPTIYNHALLNLPIPVVSWTDEQSSALEYKPFVLLLHKLGLHLPIDTGKVFVRIPNFWNAEYIFSISQMLGTIDTTKLKFDLNLLQSRNGSESRMEFSDETTTYAESTKFSINYLKMPSVVRYTPLLSSPGWFQTGLQLNKSPNTSQTNTRDHGATTCEKSPTLSSNINEHLVQMAEHYLAENIKMLPSDIEHVSICDTESVASNLTRMCVSDEEDKMSENNK